jgi:hypothetical protein
MCYNAAMGTLRKLSPRYGDLAVDWKTSNPVTAGEDTSGIDEAIRAFEEELASGRNAAVAVTELEPDGVLIQDRKFIPEATEIFTFPIFVGG